MRVDLVQAAAGAVLVAVVLVGLSKSVAATLAAWSTPAPREGTPLTGEVTTLLYQTRRLLTLVLVGPVVTLSVALPVLALSGRPYAIALACLASVGLLVRTQQVGFTDEILLLGGAGSIGLFAVLSELAFRFWTGGQAAVALTVAGLLLVGIGVGISLVRSPGREEGAGEAFSIAKPPKRRSLSDVLGLLCTIAVGPLVLGVFGVLDVLASMGRVMFG
jgi:hypothetical protein